MAELKYNELGYDTTFELNDFKQPRIRSEVELIKNTILFVLFAKPGQYPSLPTIGLDIQNRLYSFYDEIKEEDLQLQIIEQCEALGVYFDKGNVAIRKTIYNKQPSLLIHIEGTESYPDDYMNDSANKSNRYLIGITYDEMKRMVYNINSDYSS